MGAASQEKAAAVNWLCSGSEHHWHFRRLLKTLGVITLALPLRAWHNCSPLNTECGAFQPTSLCSWAQGSVSMSGSNRKLMGTSDITERILFGGAAQVRARGWCRPAAPALCPFWAPQLQVFVVLLSLQGLNKAIRSKHSPGRVAGRPYPAQGTPCNLRADKGIQMLSPLMNLLLGTVQMLLWWLWYQKVPFSNSRILSPSLFVEITLYSGHSLADVGAGGTQQLLSFNQYILLAPARTSKNRNFFNPMWKTLFEF